MKLRNLLYPGAKLIISQRLPTPDVDTMVGAVLEKIIARARSNADLDETNLLSFARKLIVQNCPALRGESQSAACLSSGDVQLAQAIVKRAAPVKRQVLRCRYLLSETPESIQAGLYLGSKEYMDIIADAKSCFFLKSKGRRGRGRQEVSSTKIAQPTQKRLVRRIHG
jgi:hypothetical protein